MSKNDQTENIQGSTKKKFYTDSRVYIILAIICLLLTYAFPLYRMTLKSNFYPEGLVLDIYSYKLRSGHNNTDLREINVLNHYIGMKEIKEEDFPEFTWLPIAIGAVTFIALLALLIKRLRKPLLYFDTAFLIGVGLFGFYRFYKWLYHFGHDLDPRAAIKVQGFTPPLIGFKQIANFGVYNMPQLGVYGMILATIFMIVAIYFMKKPVNTGG